MNRIALVLTLAAAVSGVVGCGAAPRAATRPQTTSIITADTRVDAIVGSRLVLPLSAIPADADVANAAVPVTLADGRDLTARLYRVGVTVAPAPQTGTLGDLWLPLPGEWTAAPINDSRTIRGGTVVAVIDLPADIASSPSFVLGGVRYPINHLPVPAAIAPPVGPVGDPWQPTASDAALAPMLLAAIAPEARTPLGRWRYRLVVDGLRPLAIGEPDGPAMLPTFENAVIEAIARQNEDRWRIALLRLWVDDADLANRLKRRLAAMINFGDGRIAPAWPADHSDLDRLLATLLDPALSDARRAEIAQAWLDAQPEAVAWVIDDGGVVDANRHILAAVGIANMQDKGTLAWARPAGAIPTGDVAPLPAYTTTQLGVPLVQTVEGVTAPVSVLAAHAGSWSRPLQLLPAPIPVVPPGLSIGSLAPDFTMETWTRGQPPSSRPEWGTSVLLHQPPRGPEEPRSNARSRKWEVFVECRLLPGVGSLGNESIRLYFGPTGAPTSQLRIDIAGAVSAEQRQNELISTPPSVQVVRAADRWTFRLELPPGAVEPDGLIRMAVVRTDALGRRSTWPRPMLPWQNEPGRAAADTTAWGE